MSDSAAATAVSALLEKDDGLEVEMDRALLVALIGASGRITVPRSFVAALVKDAESPKTPAKAFDPGTPESVDSGGSIARPERKAVAPIVNAALQELQHERHVEVDRDAQKAEKLRVSVAKAEVVKGKLREMIASAEKTLGIVEPIRGPEIDRVVSRMCLFSPLSLSEGEAAVIYREKELLKSQLTDGDLLELCKGAGLEVPIVGERLSLCRALAVKWSASGFSREVIPSVGDIKTAKPPSIIAQFEALKSLEPPSHGAGALHGELVCV